MASEADPRISELMRAAEASAQAGKSEEAARSWERVLALDPNHPRALFRLGERAFRAGNPAVARDLLQRAASAAPREPGIQLNLALVERARGDVKAELAAIDRALAVDEHLLPALLMKGTLFERTGRAREAAKVYRIATAVAPEQGLPPDIAAALVNARAVIARESDALEAFLESKIAPLRARHAWSSLARFDEALGIAVGKKKAYTPKPANLLYPQLPAIGYHDDVQFPWLRHLEAAAPSMRDELIGLIKEEADEFTPYVSRPDNVPVHQWGELNRSTKWSAYFLWKDGARDDGHCKRCPITAATLEAAPLARMPDYAPTAFFSSLDPHTRIPPHTGSTNVRLIVHLPLIVPEKCTFRVANETRTWQFGKAWVFDDSIEHEAFNDSDHQRVILIFDIWNPLLTEAERDLICAMQTGIAEYYAG